MQLLPATVLSPRLGAHTNTYTHDAPPTLPMPTPRAPLLTNRSSVAWTYNDRIPKEPSFDARYGINIMYMRNNILYILANAQMYVEERQSKRERIAWWIHCLHHGMHMYENIFSISHPIPPAGVSVFCLTVAGCAHIAYCTSSLVFGCAMMGVIERKGGMKINKCVFFLLHPLSQMQKTTMWLRLLVSHLNIWKYLFVNV